MEVKAIPAFYCCYLLRSTVRRSSLYVGSTPNPLRRLGQHNGNTKGGALRTSRLSLRPWEMTCIVAGFPSNIAALQLEWAWHNSHLTRFIPADQRISIATSRTKTTKSGRTRRKPGRPHTSLTDKLSNLHLLLRASYFSKWPLTVFFFVEDVYRLWQTLCDRLDGKLPAHIKVQLDLKKEQPGYEVTLDGQPAKRRKVDLIGKGGVGGVDPSYAPLYDVLEKGQIVLDADERLPCAVCKQEMALERDLIVVCPHGSCHGTSHVSCLSKSFVTNQSGDVVPVRGKCPSCHSEVEWVEMMKELSLRTRGAKAVEQLLRKRRKAKAAVAAGLSVAESDADDDEEAEDHDEDALTMDDIGSDAESDDAKSVTSNDSSVSHAMQLPVSSQKRMEVVIDDSEDDDIVILN